MVKRMWGLLVRLLLNAFALYLLTQIYGGVYFERGTGVGEVIGTALIMGLVNVLVRPALLLLTLPINVLTLGLCTLVVNALVLMVVAALSSLNVVSFGAALLGSLLLSFINWGLESLFALFERPR